MLIRYDTDKEWQQPLINDIAPPHARPFVDVRSDTVRHHAIGTLQQQYLYSRSKSIGLTQHLSEEPVHVRRMLPFASSITRIPPLLSLPEWQHSSKAPLRRRIQKASLLLVTGWSAWQALAGEVTRRLQQIRITGFPYKRYTLAEGMMRDWPWRTHKNLRTAMPLAAAVIVLVAALALAPQESDQAGPVATPAPQIIAGQKAPAVLPPTSNPKVPPNPTSPPQSPSTYTGHSFKPISGQATAVQSPSNASQTPIPVPTQPTNTGGMGGGDTTVPSDDPVVTQPILPLPEIPIIPVIDNLLPGTGEDGTLGLLDN